VGCGEARGETNNKAMGKKKITLGVGGDTGSDYKVQRFFRFFPLFVVVGVHFVFLFTLSP
jgi:hypothetical protein